MQVVSPGRATCNDREPSLSEHALRCLPRVLPEGGGPLAGGEPGATVAQVKGRAAGMTHGHFDVRSEQMKVTAPHFFLILRTVALDHGSLFSVAESHSLSFRREASDARSLLSESRARESDCGAHESEPDGGAGVLGRSTMISQTSPMTAPSGRPGRATVAIEFANELGLALNGDRLCVRDEHAETRSTRGRSSRSTDGTSTTSRRWTRCRWTRGSS